MFQEANRPIEERAEANIEVRVVKSGDVTILSLADPVPEGLKSIN